MTKHTPITVRKACRNRMPLDGADAQALEGALAQIEKELIGLKFQCEKLAERADEAEGEAQDFKAQFATKSEAAYVLATLLDCRAGKLLWTHIGGFVDGWKARQRHELTDKKPQMQED